MVGADRCGFPDSRRGWGSSPSKKLAELSKAPINGGGTRYICFLSGGKVIFFGDVYIFFEHCSVFILVV